MWMTTADVCGACVVSFLRPIASRQVIAIDAHVLSTAAFDQCDVTHTIVP